jgi:hypothetical protein
MTWNTPVAVADGDDFKASDYNKYIRDNLMASEAAQVTQVGQRIVSGGLNSIETGTFNTSHEPGEAFNSSSTDYIDTDVQIRAMYCHGRILIAISGELEMCSLSFKLTSSTGTVIPPDTALACVNGLESRSAQSFTYSREMAPGLYNVQVYAAKDSTSGVSGPGLANNVMLTVLTY